MSSRAELAAVVLAGGASRRMGRDKATMPHPRSPDQTMLEHTVGVLSTRCAPIFVVAAPGQPLPALDGVSILRDEARGIGPLLATGRGLRAAADAGADWAFVTAVDMPNLDVGVIDDLARYRGDDLARYRGVDVVLPWDGRDHYLAAVYRTALADRIDELVAAGERRMRALCDGVVAQRVLLPVGDVLANVNSPAHMS